jgi:hypothetical protein
MNFGMQTFANHIVTYKSHFKRYKQLERDNNFNVEEIIKKDDTWFLQFTYFTVLILAASVGEYKLVLRYLLN